MLEAHACKKYNRYAADSDHSDHQKNVPFFLCSDSDHGLLDRFTLRALFFRLQIDTVFYIAFLIFMPFISCYHFTLPPSFIPTSLNKISIYHILSATRSFALRNADCFRFLLPTEESVFL